VGSHSFSAKEMVLPTESLGGPHFQVLAEEFATAFLPSGWRWAGSALE
jgi:hypothetical protein